MGYNLPKPAWILILIWLSLQATAQNPFPAPGPVFRDDLVPVVRLTIHPDSLSKLYQSPQSNHEYPATFVFESGDIKDTLPAVGVRFRGNTSRSSGKKSFKISFNTFFTRQTFFGLEKMNLNGEHNDPSVMRSKLYWDLCRLAGIPAPRANHVRLYVNNEYKGLYINVEQIDEEFAALRFGDKSGNLYKCLYPADLTYRGSAPDNYKFTSGSRRAYSLKTNELEDDYSDLANLIDRLNNSSPASFAASIESVLNVPVAIRIIMVDVLTGNWDGPFYNKNNFYLYHNPCNDRFELIPYDVDNTFGIDWFNIDWARRNIYTWSPSQEARPLYTKILSHPPYRAEFTRLTRDFISYLRHADYLTSKVTEIRNRISEYVETDPLYALDYGWHHPDFLRSIEERLNTSHVKYGLIPYIRTRLDQANTQLDAASGLPEAVLEEELRIRPNPAFDRIGIAPLTLPVHYTIVNRLGAIAKTGELDTGEIDVSDLSPGFYVLILSDPVRIPGVYAPVKSRRLPFCVIR